MVAVRAARVRVRVWLWCCQGALSVREGLALRPLRTTVWYHIVPVASITELLTNITELLQKPYRIVKYE